MAIINLAWEAMAPPLHTAAVPIATDCLGERWSPNDIQELARYVATVAMGQSSYAAYILERLGPAGPAFSDANLVSEARVLLTVDETQQVPRVGYPRTQRDGFIFETISWLAARQAYGKSALLKDPHVRATTQGLDGLMIEVSDELDVVTRTTIFEDKCTDEPRRQFTRKVMPGFQERHSNKRNAELISCATTLLKTAGVQEPHVTLMAAAVTDQAKRRYRAAFAVSEDSENDRKALFKGFGSLAGLTAEQRIGACFVVQPVMRDWFDGLAAISIRYLSTLVNGTNV